MLVVLLGPPGAGKGTQAERIVEKFNLSYISTGDILRAAVKSDSLLGKKAREYMEQGRLVPDSVVVSIVNERLLAADCQSGALLDGFPRTVVQAEALQEVLASTSKKIARVILIDVDEEELIARLTGRRVCRDCGSTYHVKFNAPKVRNVCDNCGGELYQREDDSLATVKERLRVYYGRTKPLIEFYRERGLLENINGNGKIEEISKQITSMLEKI